MEALGRCELAGARRDHGGGRRAVARVVFKFVNAALDARRTHLGERGAHTAQLSRALVSEFGATEAGPEGVGRGAEGVGAWADPSHRKQRRQLQCHARATTGKLEGKHDAWRLEHERVSLLRIHRQVEHHQLEEPLVHRRLHARRQVEVHQPALLRQHGCKHVRTWLVRMEPNAHDNARGRLG